MKGKIAVLIFVGSLMLARADQMIESVQQTLKACDGAEREG